MRSDLVAELSPVFNQHPGFLEDLVVQGQVSHRSAQPGIVLFQLLESFGLVELQTTMFIAPRVEGLLGDPL